MKKLFSYFLFLSLFSSTSFSQVSINAGASVLKGFTTDKSFYGLNAGLELPRSNDITFYGRIGYYIPRNDGQINSTYVTAINSNTSPYQLNVNYQTKMNYTTIEGGTRYYLGNDYDNGFSIYGGGNFMLYINSVKRDYESEDATGTYTWETNYQLFPNEFTKGQIISLAMGLQGGMKYTIPGTGTIYLDINGQYTIFGQASNSYISSWVNQSNFYSPLFFTFNLGFRKDLY